MGTSRVTKTAGRDRARPGEVRRSPGPRRPRPSRAVIWRRRTVALLILVALLAGVIWGVGALVRTLAAEGAEVSATAPPSEQQPAAVDPGPCEPAGLDVTVDTDADGAGKPVTFGLTLTNSGEAACLLDAGREALALTVRSGDDRVWSSADCPLEPASHELLLDAGDSAQTSLTWTGSRSAAGCPSGQGAAGAGTYRVEASLDGAPVELGRETFTLG